jgi:hypothetical protein
VIGGGQHFAILKDAGGLADLNGTRFQDFDLVDDDFFDESHFRNCRLAKTGLMEVVLSRCGLEITLRK